MLHRAVLFLLVMPAIAAAQRNAQAEQLCLHQGSQAEARTCLQAQAKLSADAVLAAERAALAALERWDQEPSYKARSKAALQASTQAFYRARHAECEFQATLAAGGNGATARRLLCEVELNRQRMGELQSIVASLQ
jgi:uncharacterized protein YecT (DUF1311 family)